MSETPQSETPILLTSNLSPFGRVTRIARLHLGLQNRIGLDMRDPDDAKVAAIAVSPLGKVPLLLLGPGAFLADSRTILGCFDRLAPNGRLFGEGEERHDVATRLAIALGALDAALSILYERRFHPALHRSAEWEALQTEKITQTVAHLEKVALTQPDDAPTIAEIAFGVVLEYLDFRFDGVWRHDHPELPDWLEKLAGRVIGFSETAPG